MTRFWTCHWRNSSWRNDVNRECKPVRSYGSDSFRKRGVAISDVAYIISLVDGQLLLGGRMTVRRIVSREERVRIWGPGAYDADEWIIDEEESGTSLNLHRRLAPAVSRQLRFVSPKSGPRSLFFISDTRIYAQATRGVQNSHGNPPNSSTELSRSRIRCQGLGRSSRLRTRCLPTQTGNGPTD